MLLYSRYIPEPIIAITLFPFIVINRKYKKYINEVLLNHELIHIEQQKELLVIFFYIWYLIEWFFLFLYYLDIDKAYRSIRFEKEAYNNESDLGYLAKRKRYNYV